jgi:hypothetical protein
VRAGISFAAINLFQNTLVTCWRNLHATLALMVVPTRSLDGQTIPYPALPPHRGGHRGQPGGRVRHRRHRDQLHKGWLIITGFLVGAVHRRPEAPFDALVACRGTVIALQPRLRDPEPDASRSAPRRPHGSGGRIRSSLVMGALTSAMAVLRAGGSLGAGLIIAFTGLLTVAGVITRSRRLSRLGTPPARGRDNPSGGAGSSCPHEPPTLLVARHHERADADDRPEDLRAVREDEASPDK